MYYVLIYIYIYIYIYTNALLFRTFNRLCFINRVSGTHTVDLFVSAQQTIALFGKFLDQGVDVELLLMRRRFNFKLSKNDFLSAMGSTGGTSIWHQGCGPRSKTSFISERKPISVTFFVKSEKVFHNHEQCLRCQSDSLSTSRPSECNTETKYMKPLCCLTIRIPWGTGVKVFSEPIY